MSDIIVGYDGSETADIALDKAVEIAKSTGGQVVIAFGYAPTGAGGGEVRSHREAVKEMGEQFTAKGKARAESEGVSATVEMMPMHGAAALAELAAERDAMMIVVGTRGESALKGVILGSTPQKLLQVAKVPVLVVPGAAD